MRTFATYEEENIHYWTHRASGYSAVNQEELATDQKAVWRGVIAGKIAGNHPGKRPDEIRVLDVGTGPGFFAIILAELGYQVTAVDYTASMLEEARRRKSSAWTPTPSARDMRRSSGISRCGGCPFSWGPRWWPRGWTLPM